MPNEPNLPLPSELRTLLMGPSFVRGAGNRSLLFDRGMDQYDPGAVWAVYRRNEQNHEITEEGKHHFLNTFRDHYSTAANGSARDEYEKFYARRASALKSSGAKAVNARTASRLIVGMGLPHPTQTSLLFDRLTGVPYIPGSSVKGFLRAAAELVAREELSSEDMAKEDVRFWQENIERLFGPPIEKGKTPRRGQAAFFDALPSRWPGLDLDVLTPHYTEYYENQLKPPADWYSPVPVPFLTVSAGAVFTFWFQGCAPGDETRRTDEESLERLLRFALDWLGIGAKTSSGYGAFEPGGGQNGEERETLTWSNVHVTYTPNDRIVTVKHDGKTAFRPLSELEAEEAFKDRLKKKPVQADVDVEGRGNAWTILALRPPKGGT